MYVYIGAPDGMNLGTGQKLFGSPRGGHRQRKSEKVAGKCQAICQGPRWFAIIASESSSIIASLRIKSPNGSVRNHNDTSNRSYNTVDRNNKRSPTLNRTIALQKKICISRFLIF